MTTTFFPGFIGQPPTTILLTLPDLVTPSPDKSWKGVSESFPTSSPTARTSSGCALAVMSSPAPNIQVDLLSTIKSPVGRINDVSTPFTDRRSSQEQHALRRALSGSGTHSEALAEVGQNWSQRVSHSEGYHRSWLLLCDAHQGLEVWALARVISMTTSVYIFCCLSRTVIMTWSSTPPCPFIAYTIRFASTQITPWSLMTSVLSPLRVCHRRFFHLWLSLVQDGLAPLCVRTVNVRFRAVFDRFLRVNPLRC